MPSRTIIIGAGLTGLCLAYFLHRRKHPVLVLEARYRPGGRIRTARDDRGTPLELGATWLGKKHTALVGLLDHLGIGTFEQRTGGRAIYESISTSPPQVIALPPNDQPSYRIAGGSDTLIEALVDKLPKDIIKFGAAVCEITTVGNGLKVVSNQGAHITDTVVSTLPPNLLARSIDFVPPLPDELLEVARSTQTWMGESIKVGLRYAEPFWRQVGKPGGTIFSNVGPVTEMYDHTDAQGTGFGLKGFMNGNYFSLQQVERRELVLNQLRKYYGPIVDGYTAYEEGVWRQEEHTFTPYDAHVLPHQNNGHSIFREAYMGGRFYVAGSETAEQFPGYMDGAVRSARWVAERLVYGQPIHPRLLHFPRLTTW